MPAFAHGAESNEVKEHMEEYLEKTQEEVRHVLRTNVPEVVTKLMVSVSELQRDTAETLMRDITALRFENQKLRSALLASPNNGIEDILLKDTGGTGGTVDPPPFLRDANAWSQPKASAGSSPSNVQPPFKLTVTGPQQSAPEMLGPGAHQSSIGYGLSGTETATSIADFMGQSQSQKKQKATKRVQLRSATQDYEPFDSNAEDPLEKDISSKFLKNKDGTPRDINAAHHNHKELPQAVFADASAMKEKVRAAVARKEYNVCDFYFTTGYPQKIARAQWFEYLTLSVIAFNALWISIDADLNTSPTVLGADPIFQIADHGFTIYFTWEWLTRFLSFERKRNCCRDAWFVFDSCMVAMLVGETWVMTIVILAAGGGADSGMGNTSVLKLVRLARLTRMARMAKLLRAIPELVILIKGMAVASRSVGFTLILLTLLIYFFAIVFRQLMDNTEVGDEYFYSVPKSMMSLLMDGVLPDQASIVMACADQSFLFGAICLLFILLSGLMVMNMLVGVLCEVVSVVSSVEKETLTVNYVKQRLQQMFGDWDQDGNLTISKGEFERLLVLPDAALIIQEIGVDVIGLVDFADFIFKDGSELSFADFMELILSFRGSNQSTVKDIVDLRKFVLSELCETKEDIVYRLEEITDELHAKQKEVHDVVKASAQGLKEEQEKMREERRKTAAMRESHAHNACQNDNVVAISSRSLEKKIDNGAGMYVEEAPASAREMRPASANFIVRPLSSPGNRPPRRPGTAQAKDGNAQGGNALGGNARQDARPVSAQLPARLNNAQNGRNGTPGTAQERGASPPLPDFPQTLWIGEIPQEDTEYGDELNNRGRGGEGSPLPFRRPRSGNRERRRGSSLTFGRMA
jgi:hypothetical protein